MSRRPLYSDFASYYDRLFGSVDEACLDLVQEVVPPPAAVLDAGCGTGQYAEALAARGYRVVAADREAQLVRARATSSSGVSFILADIRQLPLAGPFDVILARGVLNDMVALGDLAGALRCLASALSDSGRFVADVRERVAHRQRMANHWLVELRAGAVTFRARRRMEEEGMIVSREQFAREGVWSAPFEFRMRTFTEGEVRGLWRAAGLEVLSISSAYGAASRLTDRLVVIASKSERLPRQGEA